MNRYPAASSPGSLSGAVGHCSASAQPPHLGKSGSVVRLSVPIHGNKPLKTGLLRHLAKLVEIPDEEI
jgi:hypothetical protein